MLNAENEIKKWDPVLEHADAPSIKDGYKKAVVAKLLENTEKALQEEHAASSYSLNEAAPNMQTQAVANFDPVLISLVRRAMPNLIAFDVAGVQPMSGPTGLIFAMKAKYNGAGAELTNDTGSNTANGTEAFGASGSNSADEADTAFSGTGDHLGSPEGQVAGGLFFDSPESQTAGSGFGMALGDGEVKNPAEMGFTIDKATVTAKTRTLKAEYSMELAQDLKAVHGLDAESELANILSGEILAEINREVIRTIIHTGKLFQGSAAANGKFDLASDADGRWLQEKFQSLVFQIEQAANAIAEGTRRGKGNYVIASSNVASALAAAGAIKFGGAGELQVDATGNTFAGTLNGGLKVYVDPYALQDYAVVGYKGTNPYDAGLFYCPYVPLQMVRAVSEDTFQPRIAFKTRYGMADRKSVV